MKEKWLFLALAVLLLSGGSVWAADSLFEDAKGLIDKLEPRVGHFWNLESGEHHALIGSKFLSYREFSAVGGYAVNKTVVGAVEVDVFETLSKLPGVKVEVPWVRVSAGFGGGYSWDSNDPVYGPTFDVSARF